MSWIAERIPKKSLVNDLVKPIIPLERPVKKPTKKDELKHIDHQCHNTPGDTTTGKYTIKVPMYDSGDPEEWIIFRELVGKCMKGQNITAGPQMYQLVQRVLQGDAKAEFDKQARNAGNQTAANFESVMTAMTVHVFPRYAYRDQKRYLQRYLQKPTDMKVRTFSTRLSELNSYLPSFPPDSMGQNVVALSDDELKDVLYVAMPDSYQRKMTEQGYNYLDPAVSLHTMTDFFEARCENLESKKKSKKGKKGSKKSKSVLFSEASDEEFSEDEKSTKKYCAYHGLCSHTSDACDTLKELIKRDKKKSKFSKNNKGKGKKTYSKHEVNALVDKRVKKFLKNGKKKKRHEVNEFQQLEVSEDEKSHSSNSSSSSSSSSDSE